MGQIANQMALELLHKMKQRIAEKKAQKKVAIIILVLAVIAGVILLLTGCVQDAIKDVKKDDYELTFIRCEDEYRVAGSSINEVFPEWGMKGEFPSMEDGQFACMKADITIRTGGEAGYYEDVFIREVKSFEILSIDEVVERNLITKYTDGIVGHNGLEVIQAEEKTYYIQSYKGNRRVYLYHQRMQVCLGEYTDKELYSKEKMELLAEMEEKYNMALAGTAEVPIEEAESKPTEPTEIVPVAELVNKQTDGQGVEKTMPETLPKKDYTAPDCVVMVPTEANLTGMHSGYLFLPVDGAVYRYEPNDTSEDSFTMGDLIYECSEFDVLGTTRYWEVYELEEFPNHEKIKCVPKGESDSCIFKYAPALRTDKEVYEEAEKRGFVIIKGFRDEIINKDNWFTFLDKVAAGKPASVCIGNLYSNEEMNMSADIREATNEDYSNFFLTELVYDGVEFTVSPVNWMDGNFVQCEIPGYNSPEQTYPYLMHYVDKGRTGMESFVSYDKYVLTDRDDVTWNDLEMDMILCTFSMRYYEVYAEYVMK